MENYTRFIFKPSNDSDARFMWHGSYCKISSSWMEYKTWGNLGALDWYFATKKRPDEHKR